ncbi:MAG: hypothetical protein K9I68_05730 [Bacteroidales bacterium]|nr:hypothetical protein [Bacteroidales bacterium]MCF8338267.1 hypothetical protein [Bacteroidales bacterium]
MKNLKRLTGPIIMGVIVTTAILISGCTKEGPQGPPGEDGEDASSQCGTCHDVSTEIQAKEVQWASSKHKTGGNFERNASYCAGCHTSEGFIDVIENGNTSMVASESPTNPSPIGCKTCHQIHQTYTPQDYQLTTSEPVDLIVGDEPADMGKGNVCANCHQARDPEPLPQPGGGDVAIESPYWGPHHGTQTNMIAAQGGVEFEGDYDYSTGPHSDMEGGCVTCHMSDPYGDQAGGHNMSMTYAYHGHDAPLTSGCTQCHEGEDFDFNYGNVQTETEELLAELETKLIEQGIMDEEDHAIPGTYSATEAGALYNYLFVMEDSSAGVHNSNYSEALLKNSIDKLDS